MNLIEAFLMGISLAMDALAVSVALGTVERKNFNGKKIFLTAFFFGAFQFLMPLAGWFGGGLCGSVIQTFGRYIASALLVFLGGKMIREAFQKDGEEEKAEPFSFARLVLLSFATSIDAFLVGVSYACLGRTAIGLDITIIGCITFLISASGCVTGRFFGNLFGNKCDIFGGCILIFIAAKVLFFG